MNTQKTRMLFVDDEPMVLEVLQIVLAPMGNEWDLAFASSGQEALALMARRPFEVVVSDMLMPGMNGAELLNEVWKRHPSTFRLILSGYADAELILQCVGVVHQLLLKPFKLAELKTILHRLHQLKQRLGSERIRTLVTKKGPLPGIPAVYLKILTLMQNPDCSLDQVGEVVSQDAGLSAKILQLVNSAFFGVAREVSNATEAVMLLGVGTIRTLALSLQLFSKFDLKPSDAFSVEQIWNHSLRVGLLARKIAEMEGGDQRLMEQAFTAGVMHDVGKLILADNLSRLYLEIIAQARSQNRPLIEAEREGIQATHADVGAHLLDLWGLPTPLVEAIALHHEPSLTGDPVFSPLTAVHAANVLEQENNDKNANTHPDRLDDAYLSRLGLTDRIECWRNISP